MIVICDLVVDNILVNACLFLNPFLCNCQYVLSIMYFPYCIWGMHYETSV